MNDAGPLVLILVMLVVFYLFLLRPQRTAQKQMRQLQESLQVGQEVILSAGIFGTVRGLDDARAQIEVAPGTVLTVARQVVVRRVEEPLEGPADSTNGAPGTPGQV